MPVRGTVVSFASLRVLAAFATALACAALARPAAADAGSDPAAADALFQKGREAAEKGEWTVACPKFAESQRLDPALGTLLNLAECEEHLGHLATAYEYLKTVLDTMPPGDDRLGFAKQRLAGLEKTVPHLTLSAPADFPADVKVMRDDVQLGSASFGLPLPVNPGPHAIVVTAPGHADRRIAITIKAGEAETLPLRLGDALPAPPPPPLPIVGPRDTASPTQARGAQGPHGAGVRTAGFVVGAVGIAGLGAGAVTGLLVLGKKSIVNDPAHCDPTTHVCDAEGLDAARAGKTLSTASTVAFVAGGALVVTGLVMVLAGSGAHSSPSATLVTPDAYAGGGAGLRVIHSF